jgi:hypothetical protein
MLKQFHMLVSIGAGLGWLGLLYLFRGPQQLAGQQQKSSPAQLAAQQAQLHPQLQLQPKAAQVFLQHNQRQHSSNSSRSCSN